MKKVLIVVGMLLIATSLFAADSWTGYVTDSKCAASGKTGPDHAGCAASCIKRGDSAVLVTTDGKIVKIANQDKVAGHAGHHVTLTGKLDGDTLTIASLTMIEDPKKP